MIDRRLLLAGMTAGFAVSPSRLAAQQGAPPVIGFLNNASAAQWQPFLAAFEQGLAEAGLRVGQNISIEYRWAEGRNERLPSLAADLVSRNVRVLVATGGPDPAQAAKSATGTIPIVFTVGPDPVQLGLVESLARPGRNLTGFTLFTGRLAPKRVELLRELFPAAKTIALLTNPTSAGSQSQIADVRNITEPSGVRVSVLDASSDSEIDDAIANRSVGADALFVASDSFFYTRAERITMLAAARRLPAVYEARAFAEAGGLISYGIDFPDVYRRAAGYVARILKGEKPSDLPVEQPTRFELVVNLKAAKAMGVTVPQIILLQADEVIE